MKVVTRLREYAERYTSCWVKDMKIYHRAKKIHFKKQGELQSLESKSNATGLKFRENTLIWNGLSIKVLVKPQDDYAQRALLQTIKYCRVVKNGANYSLQLVIEGIPPVKINKKGEFRHKANVVVGLLGSKGLGKLY